MLLSLVVVTLLYRFACASTVLGPQSDLHLVNGNIAPDGFTRPYVQRFYSFEICSPNY